MTDESRQQFLKQVHLWEWLLELHTMGLVGREAGSVDSELSAQCWEHLLSANGFVSQMEFHPDKSVSNPSNKMFFSPLKNVLCLSEVVKWVSEQHLLEFFYSRKSEKSGSALLKSVFGLITWNKADRWAGRVIYKLQQKKDCSQRYVELFISQCPLHFANTVHWNLSYF